MASSSYHHGARIEETTDAPLTITTVSTAVIGIVCTASDADPQAYPLNTPVLLSSASAGLAKAGTKGTLAASLQAIDDQVTCQVVVVRVQEGNDLDATNANLIGGVDANGAFTGMKALLMSRVRPRILGVPGFDAQEVTAALLVLAKKLKGFGYATCHNCNSVTDALAFRELLNGRELMLIWPDFTAFDTATARTAKAMTVAIALGTRARLDQEVGWHRVISNVPVNNVNGISAGVEFDYLTEGTDADILNQAGITTLINRDGFRFWGSRTCDKGTFVFENYTRTAQTVAETIGQGVFEYSDKDMHASLVRDVIESINAKLRTMTRDGQLLGGRCWYDKARNDKDSLKAGGLRLAYNYTPVPPMEDLQLRQTFTDEYVANLSAAIDTTTA
ncbi:phage tail sheath subtilisin-like domain-containing protein [Dyella sp. ASV21]|uniref:phage tail sheath subtilisin-like domain-containing protein n=1 Tax=Dyella sp. ASV21 TaxID=2795114 RepID=UPI0018EC10D4|nr:phage tail sheath subtilisin-like domain-containing protein [Dyella sp. ASV21]